MYNYDYLLKLALENKAYRVRDLLALAPANDPFYVGRPSELEGAEWFAELWNKFGYGPGTHLRRVHYQIVSQSPAVKMPNGKGQYENTLNCWAYLNNASKWARYLELVPPWEFVDRRNPEAVINAHFPKPGNWDFEEIDPGYSLLTPYENPDYREYSYLDVPKLPVMDTLPHMPDLPDFDIRGYEGIQQDYLIEIWVEKTTMNDVLKPLCRYYNANLVTGAGELSITAVIDFINRVQVSEKKAVILYVSDYDPAGLGMPISVARKVEYYMRKSGLNDITLEPIVLTSEQVERYNLPRVPVKDSDKRKSNWIRDHGEGQVELDALEALHPGVLYDITEAAICKYYDKQLGTRARAVRSMLKDDLDQLWRRVFGKPEYRQENDHINARYEAIYTKYEEIRKRFNELANQLKPDLEQIENELGTLEDDMHTVYSKLYTELEQAAYEEIDLEDYPLPEANVNPYESPLFASNRDYFTQLDHYKRYRKGA